MTKRPTSDEARGSETPPASSQLGRSVAQAAFLTLFGARLIADAAFLPGGAQSLLNQLVILVAIACGLLAAASDRGRRKIVTTIPIFLTVFFTWYIIAASEVGFTQPITSAVLRFTALLGMAVLAFKAVRDVGFLRFAKNVAATSLPFVVALSVGALSRSPLLYSAGTGRAFGTFNHTNSAASFVAVFVLLVVYLLFREKKARYGFMLLIGLVGVVGTLSLGGLSALVAGLAIMLAASKLPLGAKLFAYASLGVAGSVVLASGSLDARLSQLQTTVSFDDATSATSTNSLDWRFYNWRRFLDLFGERPLIGWGLGRADFDLQPIGKQPHNEYVRALVETGIVGTAILAVLVLVLVLSVLRVKDVDGWGRALAIATLSTLLVNAVASNTTSYAPTMMLAVAAWAVGMSSRSTASAAPPTGARVQDSKPMERAR